MRSDAGIAIETMSQGEIRKHNIIFEIAGILYLLKILVGGIKIINQFWAGESM